MWRAQGNKTPKFLELARKQGSKMLESQEALQDSEKLHMSIILCQSFLRCKPESHWYFLRHKNRKSSTASHWHKILIFNLDTSFATREANAHTCKSTHSSTSPPDHSHHCIRANFDDDFTEIRQWEREFLTHPGQHSGNTTSCSNNTWTLNCASAVIHEYIHG